jgi:hypothetical protein
MTIKQIGGTEPVQIYGAPAYGQPGRPLLLANLDLVNPVYYADDLTLVSAQASQIRPLGTVGIDGETDIWASTLQPGVNVNIDMIPGGLAWAPSAADAAEQISLLGIPSIDNPTLLGTPGQLPVFNTPLAAGGTYTSPRFTVKQFQSIFGKMFVTSQSTGNGTNPFAQVDLQFSVAADNYDPLRTEDWFVPITPYNFTYNYIEQYQGPIIGDTLTFTITNLDTEPCNLTFTCYGSYRARNRSIWKGLYQWISASGLPNPAAGLDTDDIVWIDGNLPSIANGTQFPLAGGSDLMNLWEGPVTISGNLNATALGVTVVISPLPVGTLGFHPLIGGYVVKADAAGIIQPTTIILPRHVCGISILNASGAATGTGGYLVVTGQVQPE